MFTNEKLLNMDLSTLILSRNGHARRLAFEACSLNPKCLTIGEGKLRFIKSLGEDYISLDDEIVRRREEEESKQNSQDG